MTGESGGLHDCRIPPDEQRPGLVNPVPGTPGGGETLTASPEVVCVQHRI